MLVIKFQSTISKLITNTNRQALATRLGSFCAMLNVSRRITWVFRIVVLCNDILVGHFSISSWVLYLSVYITKENDHLSVEPTDCHTSRR